MSGGTGSRVSGVIEQSGRVVGTRQADLGVDRVTGSDLAGQPSPVPRDRVPTDWSDRSTIQALWSAASWIQSQSRGQRVKLSSVNTYRQQQGQQQQRDSI